MESIPGDDSLNRLHSITFKLNDLLDGIEWKHINGQSKLEARKRSQQLSDGRIVSAAQFRESGVGVIVGCKVSIFDTGRLLPHVMIAEWSPLSTNEYEFGIYEVEVALDELTS